MAASKEMRPSEGRRKTAIIFRRSSLGAGKMIRERGMIDAED